MSEAMKERGEIKVLLVEDRIDDAELLLAEMRRRGLPVVSLRVESEPAYTHALRHFAPQLILSDYTLPDFDGPLALRIARRERPDTPFIFVSGTIGEERAIDALQQGAVDYVLKDNRARLVPAIERALKEADDREARRLALRQLEASEERFRSISEATREWIWEMDSRGVYTFSSPAVETMIGYKPHEVLGKNCLDLVSATLRPQLAQLLRRGAVERTGWRDVVLHLQHTAGGPRWLDQSALPLLNDAGNVIGYRGVTRDITQRRTQQDRIARLSRIQAVLSGINSTIVRVRERRELLREACRIAVQQGGFRMAWIGLVEPGALKATPLVWEGVDQGYLQELGLELANRDEDPGPVGEALRRKKLMVVNNIEAASQPQLRQQALARGFRSQIAMPLMVEDQAVGVLVLYAAETGFFDYEELKLLRDLAADISFALAYLG